MNFLYFENEIIRIKDIQNVYEVNNTVYIVTDFRTYFHTYQDIDGVEGKVFALDAINYIWNCIQ